MTNQINETLFRQLVTAVESTLHNLPDVTIHHLLSGSATSYVLELDGKSHWEILECELSSEEIAELKEQSENIDGQFYEEHDDRSITGYDTLDEWKGYSVNEYANHLAERLVKEIGGFNDRLKSYIIDGNQLELNDEIVENWLNELD